MQLSSISIQDFRSIELSNIKFNKNITIFCGQNNAGKTTLLEAIFFCSNLKSFKSLPNTELIKKNKNTFKISLNYHQNSLNNNIYIEKSLTSSKSTYNYKKISKKGLSSFFPCYSLVFGFNNFLLNDSSYRRDFIDSGMFHVEPNTTSLVSIYEKTIKQRNYILKTKKTKDLEFWSNELIKINESLSAERTRYFLDLNQEFIKIIDDLKKSFPEIYKEISSLEMSYSKGWSAKTYSEELLKNNDRDINLGYTSIGTHRSDIVVKSNGRSIKESGSMSTLVMSCLLINLAKINVFHVKHNYKPVLLIDDLFFGIDDKNLNTVIKLLIYSKGNIVVSAPNIYKDILEKISIAHKDIELMEVGEV